MRRRKMSHSLRWLSWPWPALLLLVSLGASVVRAQGEASISGLVTDATGSAIPRATVKIVSTETAATRAVLTDDAGRYEAPLLAVGAYEISADKTGFTTAKRSVSLVLGQSAEVDLTLSVAEIHQVIRVEAAALSAHVTTADDSGLVNERQVKDLPLNGRSYDQLLTLNPGVINYTSQRAGGVGTSNSKHPPIKSAIAASARARAPVARCRGGMTGNPLDNFTGNNFIIRFNLRSMLNRTGL